MDELDRRTLLGVVGLAGLAAAAGPASAGTLSPGAGAVAPTGRTLDEIYSKIPSLPAGSGDGRTPIPGGTSPAVINSPGSYILTGNLTVSGAAAITINASNVTLDLNGFSLIVNPVAASDVGVSLGTGALAWITIRNGHIRGGHSGVLIGQNASAVIIEDLLIASTRQYGITCSTAGVRQLIIRRCAIEDTGAGSTASDAFFEIAAIRLGGAVHLVVTDNVVSRFFYNGTGTPAFSGMYIYGPGTGNVFVARNLVTATPTNPGAAYRLDVNSPGVVRDNNACGFSVSYAGIAGSLVNGGGNV